MFAETYTPRSCLSVFKGGPSRPNGYKKSLISTLLSPMKERKDNTVSCLRAGWTSNVPDLVSPPPRPPPHSSPPTLKPPTSTPPDEAVCYDSSLNRGAFKGIGRNARVVRLRQYEYCFYLSCFLSVSFTQTCSGKLAVW